MIIGWQNTSLVTIIYTRERSDFMGWEDILKRKSGRCTKRTGKTSSNRKGKKWMACVPAGKKGKYKRVHWGQAGVKVTGKSGNTKRKKSFNARHKCSTCTGSDYSARCMACKDW